MLARLAAAARAEAAGTAAARAAETGTGAGAAVPSKMRLCLRRRSGSLRSRRWLQI